MSNVNWSFWPAWNETMSRKDFIFNNLALSFAWFVGALVFVGVAASESSLALLAGVVMVVGLFYTLLVTVVWLNNRLRDGGVASEGWRIMIIILSLLLGIVGCVAFIYCLIKPTEYPAELTVEDDDDCRDEGPR